MKHARDRCRAWLLGGLLLTACGDAGPGTTDFVPQRPEFEAMAALVFEGESELMSRALAPRMQARLADPELKGKARHQLRVALAERWLREGEVQRAIDAYRELLDEQTPGSTRHTALRRALGVAYLREAEQCNCIARHNEQSCLFPPQGGGLHEEDAPTRRALACFLDFLEAKPGHLPTRWLANVAALLVGEHPGALPKAQVIDPSSFDSEHVVARFRDVAPALGVDTFNLCGGVAVEDFDGDGLLDILTSTYDPLGALTHYRNRGDGTFEDVSSDSQANDQLGGLNLVAGDYDGDGDRDVLVLRGAWLTREGRMRNSLLRNDAGVFVDVTRAAGLAEPAYPTQAAAWGDLDGDGDLDLVVGNESMKGQDPEQDFPTQLFRNEGNGGFVDVAAAAGLTNDRYCKAVTLGDYDDDGDLDVYLSNFGPNRLYRNDGGLRFTDVAVELGVTEPAERSFASWFFDYDNDGRLDLFVTAYAGSIADLAAEALGMARRPAYPRLYRNTGGAFEDVTARMGLERFLLPMGANFGDLDGDGWLDLYLTTGDPSLESILPNVMLRSDGGRRFQDVSTAGGFGHLQKGHGVAFADLDNDGDQDIYHQLGGFYPGDAYRNVLFENPGHGQRFLRLELARAGGGDPIGARVTVRVETADGPREIHRAVGSVSSFGGSPQRVEIGLGQARGILELEVRWPGSLSSVSFSEVPLDSWLRVVEGEAAPRPMDVEPFALRADRHP